VSKLYTDGCSFTYGQGLDRKFSLASLLNADVDKSMPGKSNQLIVHDIYKNLEDYDTFVIGLTYSNRITLWNGDKPFGVFPNVKGCPVSGLEEMFLIFVKVYYMLFNSSYTNTLSDFYADSLIELFKNNNKKFIIFSLEKRRNKHSKLIMYPSINKKLADGHYNEQGMIELAELIKEKL
jgi:hypothetical protein